MAQLYPIFAFSFQCSIGICSIPSKNSISILRVEDSEVGRGEMKKLGGTFMLLAEISLYLICC